MFYFARCLFIIGTIIRYAYPTEEYERVIELLSSESSKKLEEQNYQNISTLISDSKRCWDKRLDHFKEQRSLWRSQPSLGPEDMTYINLGEDSCKILANYWGNFEESFKRFLNAQSSFKIAYHHLMAHQKMNQLSEWGIAPSQISFYGLMLEMICLEMELKGKTLCLSFLKRAKELHSQSTLIKYPTTGYFWTAWGSSIRKASRVWNEGTIFDAAPDFIMQIALTEELVEDTIKPFTTKFLACFPSYPSPKKKDLFLKTVTHLAKALEIDSEKIKKLSDGPPENGSQ